MELMVLKLKLGKHSCIKGCGAPSTSGEKRWCIQKYL